MPDITLSITGNITRGSLNQSVLATGVTADMASTGMMATTLQLGTATTQINTANMSTLGYAFARSLVTATAVTATVSFGRLVAGTLYEACTLRPGEVAALRLSPGDYAAKAAAANLPMVVEIFEG